MKLYSSSDDYRLYHGNMLDMPDVIELDSIDAIVTDPPYELNFMGKNWDRSGIAFQKETWEKCFQVLKPGAYLLCFAAPRTQHRIACAIEDAGFEIKDQIFWVFGSGFPKSMDLGKSIESKLTTGSANKTEFKNLEGTKTKSGDWGISKLSKEQGFRPEDYCEDNHLRTVAVDYQTEEGKKWDGWGTQLKPAYEPVIVARKPCEGSITENVLKWGVGGINIDECRIPTYGELIDNHKVSGTPFMRNADDYNQVSREKSAVGRFPANLMLTYDDTDFEEVCGGFPDTISSGGTGENSDIATFKNLYGNYKGNVRTAHLGGIGDSGSAARYFYCAKASRKDRDEGLPVG